MFSRRTSWHRQPNRLAELLESHRRNGKSVIDLTVSNPTEAGFEYPEKEILAALTNPESLQYRPDSRGLLSAREAISSYYRSRNITADPTDVFLTACTSEAYSLIFKLLCNAGDTVLVPRPSYPLFDYLAQIDDVSLQHYRLDYDHGWHVDIDSIRKNITATSRAIVLIHPHNPAGMFIKMDEFQKIEEIARQRDVALIVDEVFVEFRFDEDSDRSVPTTRSGNALTFTLNGISKMLGLPQMKLGWIVLSGERRATREAGERLEILCDTFLSVNTPAQLSLPRLLEICTPVQESIRQHVRSNYRLLEELTLSTPCSILSAEGGWSGVIRLPKTRTDEEWGLEFLQEIGVLVQPGYFFDFEEDGLVVVSLLVKEDIFRDGITRLARHSSSRS